MQTLIGSLVIAAFTLIWQMATAIPFTRQPRAACFSEKEQLAFETAQSDCIEETSEKLSLNEGDIADPEEISDELYRLLDYFTHGGKPRKVFVPRAEVLYAFSTCFKEKAATALSPKLTAEDFKAIYLKDGMLVLLDKVNKVECHSKFAAVDVLDPKYVQEVRQKWEKLGFMRRAFKSVLTKVTGWFNGAYVDCFTRDKIQDATLPMLMCGSDTLTDKKIQEIFQKCLNDNLLPAAKKELEKKVPQSDKSVVQLGERWKAFIDAWICDKKSPRPKRSMKGAGRILKRWPAWMLAGIFGAAAVVVVYAVMGFVQAAPEFLCCVGAVVGAFMGGLAAVILVLYCFVGIPIKVIGQSLSSNTDADNYDRKQALEDAKKIPLMFLLD